MIGTNRIIHLVSTKGCLLEDLISNLNNEQNETVIGQELYFYLWDNLRTTQHLIMNSGYLKIYFYNFN